MIKNHFILGTAGHVDHGKTALIKALTGIECDTHPEEKIRGITISLGFAYLDFPNGTSIGIVDVPGHKDFLNTMISGACGIDLVMLVVAADSGVMPQTIEHIQISQMLGIKSGVVVLTKADLVDEEMLLVVEEEIREFTKDTFLKDAAIFKVSSKTGKGISELNDFLSQLNRVETNKCEDGIFRMFIDRIFSVSGFGTVVTGSVISGSLKAEDKVFLLPGNKELRVRRLERHGKEVNTVYAGDRAAINITGLKKEEFLRGMVISEKIIQSTQMVDAQVKLINRSKKIELWSHVIFLSGTYESRASIHLIDVDNLKCGETAFSQIHLEQPIVIHKGDKFIIRNTSGDTTLGGGEIIDPYPLHHRRRTEKVISELKNISKGGITELITAEIRKSHFPITLQCIAEKQNLTQQETDNFLPDSLPDDIVYFKTENSIYFILAEQMNRIKNRIIKNLENYHKLNPLDENGKTFEELMGIWGVNRNYASEGVMKCILDKMAADKILETINSTWTIFSHKVTLTDQDIRQINFVESFHKNCGMNTPLMSELIPKAHNAGIPESKLKQILLLLTKQKKLYCIDDNYIHRDLINDIRGILLNYLKEHPEGITVAQFRDLINGNRKICLLLLTQFDKEGITNRQEDLRFITEKGWQKSYGLSNSSKKLSINFVV